MSDIVVKGNVRYRAKDAEREDLAPVVQVKVPVEGTDAYAQAEADKARAALQAELNEQRRAAEAEIEQRRADFERELEERRQAAEASAAAADTESGDEDEKSDDAAKKVVEPDTTKVREPKTVKRGRGRQADTTGE